MPFLDATALENDPEGMAFLRAVIRPSSEKEEGASRPIAGPEARRSVQVPLQSGEVPMGSLAAQAAAGVPTA
jgi:hypothetical protein